MAGRSMIVGRSRSHIVGAALPREYAELAEFTGATHVDQWGRPMIVGAGAPAVQERGVPVAYVRSDQPQVVEEQPHHSRGFPIGFQSTVPIPANTTVGIEQKPQVLFRG